MTLIDLTTEWTIDPAQFLSKSQNSPFGGWPVHARAHTVLVDGEVRYTLAGTSSASSL